MAYLWPTDWPMQHHRIGHVNQIPQDNYHHLEAGKIVCWSRMQVEAGQALASILRRKELERVTCDGTFYWGVGNAPPRAISNLAKLGQCVSVVFSVMLTKPRLEDVEPSAVLRWTRFLDMNGVPRELPDGAVVTSRGTTAKGDKKMHFALMCHSPEPLVLGDYGPFNPDDFRNFSEMGAPVGASQVTALLKKADSSSKDSKYRINLRAVLTGSYWVRLIDPVPMSLADRLVLTDDLPMDAREWLEIARSLSGTKKIDNNDSHGAPLGL